MDIAKRLRELREAKALSQGHIERRTGLLRCYISRVECGHTLPEVTTLEKWSKAFDLELYQLSYKGKGAPGAPKFAEPTRRNTREEAHLNLFQPMSERDKALLLGLAREVVKTQGKNG